MAREGPAASADPLQRSAGRRASPGCPAGETKKYNFVFTIFFLYFALFFVGYCSVFSFAG